jgi:hypothetical protein
MKMKNVLTIGLLLFVAASIAVLVLKSLRQDAEPPIAGNSALYAADAIEAGPVRDGLVAYYFHGNTRCPTCESIESYAHEAVRTAFPQQFADGGLNWRVVNYEAPGNKHFATDYGIVAPSVVLVEMTDGSQTDWKNLDRVWELVMGEKDAFLEYVRTETQTMLEKSSG